MEIYELNVGSGKWEVMVYKPWDRQVNWSYDKAPKQVNFADNGNKVEKKANFIVTTMSGGISGVIEIPTDLSDYYSYIWIDAWNPDGVGIGPIQKLMDLSLSSLPWRIHHFSMARSSSFLWLQRSGSSCDQGW